MPSSKPKKVSAKEIDAARTPKGGWTKATLAGWGVPWPAPAGWREALEAGTPIPKRKPKQRDPNRKRRVEFSVELGAAICRRVAMGETLIQICSTPDMPTRDQIHIWKQRHQVFAQQFAEARIDQHHAWADEIITLADDATQDWYEFREKPPKRFRGKEGTVMRFTRTHIERAKVQISTRQWLMQNRKDSDYSPRQTITMERGGSYAGLSVEDLKRELHLAAEQAGFKLVPIED